MKEEVQPALQQGVNQPKSNKTIFIILGVILTVVVIGIILFFSFRSSENASDTRIETATGGNEEGKIIICGDIPKDFDAQDEIYLDNHPQVKEDLLCISEAFADCKEANITFLGEQVNNILSIKKEGSDCIIDYKSGTKAIKCEYTSSQTKMLHEASIENNHPELTGLGIAFAMGMELTFGFKAGETTEQEITNKDTGQKEKILCTFYSLGADGGCIPTTCSAMNKKCGEWSDGCGNLLNCGGCEEGKMCVEGQLCLREDFAEDNGENIGTGNTVIAWGREVDEGVPIQSTTSDCKYSIYFSCDVLEEEDCSLILSYCQQKCLDIDAQNIGAAHLDNNVFQCSCSKC